MKNSLPILMILLVLSFKLKAQKIISIKDSSGLFSYFNIKKSSIINLNQQKIISNEEARIKNFNQLNFNRLIAKKANNLEIESLNYKLYINSNNRVDSLVFFQNKYVASKNGFTNNLVVNGQNEILIDILKNSLAELKLKPFQNQVSSISGTLTIPKNTERSLNDILSSQKRDISSINLSGLGLTSFPKQLKKFKNLKEVNLSKNNIENFKLKRRFRKIESLTLQNNLLGFSSIKIHKKSNIKSLNLSENFFSEIPKINPQVEHLFLARNYITHLDVKNLTNLTLLNLYSNGLEKLPKEINQLQKLKELDLYRNKLNEIPREIAELKLLETLAISHNNISQLPDNLEDMNNLKTLYVHHNKLSNLPKLPLDLETLDIGYNQFKTVEKYISPYKNLKVLDYSNNEVSGGVSFLLDFPHLKELYINYNNYPENIFELPEENKIFEALKQRLTHFK